MGRGVYRNYLCGCNSGKKYKNCCFNKDTEYLNKNPYQMIRLQASPKRPKVTIDPESGAVYER